MRPARCYNATGAAPLAATPERFRAAGIAVRGPLSVSTPGLLAGVGAMHAPTAGCPGGSFARRRSPTRATASR
ncbi:MAG: hypothetical protein WDN25_16290 [Acetobacteraceae bacterium]